MSVWDFLKAIGHYGPLVMHEAFLPTIFVLLFFGLVFYFLFNGQFYLAVGCLLLFLLCSYWVYSNVREADALSRHDVGVPSLLRP